MSYYPDIEKLSIDILETYIENVRLLPSQQVLLVETGARFEKIRAMGCCTLADLQKALKTKKHVQSFAQDSGLPEDFLTVLRREVNSYQPKPIYLKDFPMVDEETVNKLEGMGIRQTRQLFDHVRTKMARKAFCQENDLDEDHILLLTKLTDAARMKWVGPKFARLLTESTYDTLEKAANADPEEMHAEFLRLKEMTGLYKGELGIEDMKQWIDIIQIVPKTIEY